MLKDLLLSRIPAIFIRTSEVFRADAFISDSLCEAYFGKKHIGLLSWKITSVPQMYFPDNDKWYDSKIPRQELSSALNYPNMMKHLQLGYDGDIAYGVFVFHGSRFFFNDNQGEIVQKFIDFIQSARNNGDTLILIGTSFSVPAELEKLFYVYDMPLPSLTELKDMFASTVMEYISDSSEGGQEVLRKILADVPLAAGAAQGLTLFEAENAFVQSLRINGRIDVNQILKHKASVIAQSDVLELEDVRDCTMDKLVGCSAYKKWLAQRKDVYSEKARKFGLPYPKGVVCVGFPGAGKSLAAKITGNYLGLPVIRFNFARVFRSLLGDSEHTMQIALNTIDAVSPCLIWLEELNLSMGGVSGTVTDSGVMLKLVQMFLTWRQESKKPVFLFATANSLESLPPMMFRKGRVDALWFFNLPDEDTRKDLFKLHLELQGLDSYEFDLTRLAYESEDFSGAEIEHSIYDALFVAYSEGTKLNTDILLRVVFDTRPNKSFFTHGKKNLFLYESSGVLDAHTGKPLNIS